MTTQRERVRRALLKAGTHGITRVDFQSPTIDGGKPILNFPARIEELRREGLSIIGSGQRDSCTCYVLRAVELPVEALPRTSPATAEPVWPEPLFDAPPASRGAYSVYDDEAAA